VEPLTVLLASPRGFCAGVERAIRAVETVRSRTAGPVYVRHEIVHNRRVVETLRQAGVVFVEDLSEIPDGAVTVLSAHGVAREVYDEADLRRLPLVDATCPLVRRVHTEVRRHSREGRTVIVIGHAGHVEVHGICGQTEGRVLVVDSIADVARLTLPQPERVAYVTQTTLSVSDTREIIAALKARFPAIVGPDTKTICYATQNRQAALSAVAARAERLVVCGARNSSNTNRLRDLGEAANRPTVLVEEARELPRAFVDGISVLGLTAGASTPETIVQETIAQLAGWRTVSVEEVTVAEERVTFAPVDLGALDRLGETAAR
jgi:4-hydroxy-3-methylbut-2-enyl diphosphate reductase